MAGIYIHIPFCKSRCHYCDFFSTTCLNQRANYVNALLLEIELRKEETQQTPILTIYFGGGTPSLLEVEDIARILEQLYLLNAHVPIPEITLEANPGDLTLEKLMAYRNLGINRLSIGIQSFHNVHLQTLGRRHTAEQAIEAVHMAQTAGFSNISIDLMYGIPGQTLDDFSQDVQQAIGLNVQHISSYNLIYEEGTLLTQQQEKGLLKKTDENIENRMYEYLVAELSKVGFEHYEVSNFAKPDYYSRHNSSYWNHTPYVGLGAGAHSLLCRRWTLETGHWTNEIPFVRRWNVADLEEYIMRLHKRELPCEQENLCVEDYYNERIMLGLRTHWGVDLHLLQPEERTYCLQQAQQFIEQGLLRVKDNHLIASLQATEILNVIIVELMK